jgi:hypothetical protein
MTPVIFASPDFGTGACAGILMLLIAATVVAVVVLGIWLFFRVVKSPKWKRVIGLSLVGAFIPACCFVYLYEFKPYRDFKDILSGRGSVRIERMEIDGQKRHILLDEPAALTYLNERIRSAARNESEGGITYDATVHLSSGNSVDCFIYVPEKNRLLTIRFPVNSFEEGSYYLVTLPDPVPEALSHILDELRR